LAGGDRGLNPSQAFWLSFDQSQVPVTTRRDEIAAWQKKKLETAKAESKLRELVHTRRCYPTELFPVLSQIRERLAY
jgi:hypothetical protein